MVSFEEYKREILPLFFFAGLLIIMAMFMDYLAVNSNVAFFVNGHGYSYALPLEVIAGLLVAVASAKLTGRNWVAIVILFIFGIGLLLETVFPQFAYRAFAGTFGVII